MSLSWLERTDIVFAAGALEFARGHRLSRARTAPRRFEVESQSGGSPGFPIWQAALDRLAAVLASERPAAARVRLSGRLCRFALAPWSRGLTTEEERALARAVFLETYGDAARSWEVRVDNLKRGAALVICAVDADLLAGLARTFASAGWRLDSVEPLFAAALARVTGTIGGNGSGAVGASWNVLLEADWCSAALIEADAFLSMCGAPAIAPSGVVVRTLDNENVRLSREVRALRLLPGSVALPAAEDFSGWAVAQA